MNKKNLLCVSVLHVALVATICPVAAQSKVLSVVVNGTKPGIGRYYPVICDSDGMRVKLRVEGEQNKPPIFPTSTHWLLTRKDIKKDCRICLIDGNPGISESSILWLDISANTESPVKIELVEQRIGIKLFVDPKRYELKGSGKGNRIVVLRFRRIDQAGLIRLFATVHKVENDNGWYSGDVKVFQPGEYIIDIISSEGKVDGESQFLGVPVWTKKIKIKADASMIELHYDELEVHQE